MRPTPRQLATGLLSLLLAPLLLLAVPSSAQAADTYRYWTYFAVQDGEFVAAKKGPAAVTPEDGSVQAYRFAAPADFKNPNLPRADLSQVGFDSVCGDTEAGQDEKRVAVLVDYGVKADATNGDDLPKPRASCAVVPTEANGLQVLGAASSKIRTEKSSYGPMLCAIDGYPSQGCSEVAEEGTPPDGEPVAFETTGDQAAAYPAGQESEGGNGTLLAVVAAAVVVLGGGGFLLSRRSRS